MLGFPEYMDALDLFESALRNHKEKYGEIHHLVGTGLHNCGIVHMMAENYGQAKLCFQEAVTVRTAALGDSHPDVAVSTRRFQIGLSHFFRHIKEASHPFSRSFLLHHVVGFHVQNRND